MGKERIVRTAVTARVHHIANIASKEVEWTGKGAQARCTKSKGASYILVQE
jgi:hypothetical protein